MQGVIAFDLATKYVFCFFLARRDSTAMGTWRNHLKNKRTRPGETSSRFSKRPAWAPRTSSRSRNTWCVTKTSSGTPRSLQVLGDHRPVSMLSVIPALVRRDYLIEIEAVAAAPGDVKRSPAKQSS